MKRSEALQSLSRDHHKALAIAQRLRRATDAGEAAKEFVEFWKRHGEEHFQVEEQAMLPLWAHLGHVDEAGVARLALDHLRIRSMAIEVEAGTASLERLHELGDQLSSHVRFEERELFVSIERDLSDQDLARLARVVAAAEQARER